MFSYKQVSWLQNMKWLYKRGCIDVIDPRAVVGSKVGKRLNSKLRAKWPQGANKTLFFPQPLILNMTQFYTGLFSFIKLNFLTILCNRLYIFYVFSVYREYVFMH